MNLPGEWQETNPGAWRFHAPGYAVYGYVRRRSAAQFAWEWEARTMIGARVEEGQERWKPFVGRAETLEGARRIVEALLRETGTVPKPKETPIVYAKRLNPAQRQLLIDLDAITGLEPLYQEDLDAGTMTFGELWEANLRHIHDIYATACNLTGGRSGLGLDRKSDPR